MILSNRKKLSNTSSKLPSSRSRRRALGALAALAAAPVATGTVSAKAAETMRPLSVARLNADGASAGIAKFELNATGRSILLLCDGKRTVTEIATMVADEYSIPEDVALADTAIYIHTLTQAGLIK